MLTSLTIGSYMVSIMLRESLGVSTAALPQTESGSSTHVPGGTHEGDPPGVCREHLFDTRRLGALTLPNGTVARRPDGSIPPAPYIVPPTR